MTQFNKVKSGSAKPKKTVDFYVPSNQGQPRPSMMVDPDDTFGNGLIHNGYPCFMADTCNIEGSQDSNDDDGVTADSFDYS